LSRRSKNASWSDTTTTYYATCGKGRKHTAVSGIRLLFLDYSPLKSKKFEVWNCYLTDLLQLIMLPMNHMDLFEFLILFVLIHFDKECRVRMPSYYCTCKSCSLQKGVATLSALQQLFSFCPTIFLLLAYNIILSTT